MTIRRCASRRCQRPLPEGRIGKFCDRICIAHGKADKQTALIQQARRQQAEPQPWKFLK
jgi:hypothetical protein